MSSRHRATFALETVHIREVTADRGELLAVHFSDAERPVAALLSDQSLAGRTAAKRAICRLQPDLGPKDIVIDKHENGAPFLSSPNSIRIFISISHTKNAALGLAALEREGGMQ